MNGPATGARRVGGGGVVDGDGGSGSHMVSSPSGAPLTVAAVAARLGVAASTLRTWDRRYGLGPSSHEAGAHRRYTPADVARLVRMRHLTLQGVAPVDAAEAAKARPDGVKEGAAELVSVSGRRRPTDPERPHQRMLVDPLTLAAAALEPDEPRVHRMLEQEFTDQGILRMWTGLVVPARALLGKRESSDRPGVDPEVLIDAAVLTVVREVTAAAEQARTPPVQLLRTGAPTPPPERTVVLVAGPDRRTGAHVLGAALAERGVRARVRRTESAEAAEPESRVMARRGVRVMAVLGHPPGAEALVRRAAADGVEVFLVGADAPDLWLPQVRRVRSPLAAVEEIVALLEELEA
ncbi:MAG: MerR family transcriptional regulator [Georgenia sp.]